MHLTINHYLCMLRFSFLVFKCFSSTVAFGLGCDYIARFEGMGKGIQWSNINQGAKPNDNYTFLNCLIMMLIDTIIYMLLTIYIENVFPGRIIQLARMIES
jgi:ATP-binding cassette, subfamily A (ABC1), member 1